MSSDDGRYQIIDEPREGPLSRFILHPVLPFFAWMFFREAGAALFIFNAVALRGRRMWREIAMAALSYGVFWIMGIFVLYGLAPLGLPAKSVKYLAIIPIAIGLWLAYRVFVSQIASYEIRKLYQDMASFRSGGRQ